MMESGEFIKGMILSTWESKVQQATKLFDLLGDWATEEDVVPGGNKVIYVIGHLVVVSDRMFEALDLGERLYPELDDLFLAAQTPGQEYPSFSQLRKQWDIINEELDGHFKRLSLTDWLSRHHYVNEAAFELEPQRNKLNILLSRTVHMAHHIGQLVLVKPKK